MQAAGGAHVDLVVVGHEVAAFHDLDAHLARQEGVLEIGRVVQAGGEQHHGGIREALRRHRLEHVEQLLRVVLDRPHAVAPEQVGEDALHHLAVLEHVADARGRAQVVFEHVVFAVAVAHQVGADDVGVDVLGHVHAHHLAAEVPGAEDQLGRHDFFAQDALVVIDVVQEVVEGGHALGEAALQPVPLGGRDDARDQVEGEDALDAFFLAVDGEGDALVEELDVGVAAALLEGVGGHAAELLEEPTVVGARSRPLPTNISSKKRPGS